MHVNLVRALRSVIRHNGPAPAMLDVARTYSWNEFGDRVGRITVKGLVVHTIVGERYWIRHIRSCPPGGEIAGNRQKSAVIASARSAFRSQPELAAITSEEAWIQEALREQGLDSVAD